MTNRRSLRQWIKAADTPLSAGLFRAIRSLRGMSMPVIPGVHIGLYYLHRSIVAGWANATRVLWYTPLLKARLDGPAPGLYAYGGMPLILGPLRMKFGSDVRISGQTTLSGRTSTTPPPELIVGSNVDIGWQTTIAVGRTVRLGDNVRIAGRAFLAGYPGHPMDAAARAKGLPDTEDQARDIVLEDDVWLATGVTVSAGVTIGQGTIVAAGSVVTHDLPPNVLAGGCPARVIRKLQGS